MIRALFVSFCHSFALYGGRGLAIISCILMGFSVFGCHSKQQSDEEWVDSVLQAIDSIPEDTLFYEEADDVLNVAVDENFNDFIYAFLHSKTFQMERVAFPVPVVDGTDNTERVIRSGRDFNREFAPTANDYYVLLLSNISQMEADPASQVNNAELHIVDLDNAHARRFAFSNNGGEWKMTSENVEPFAEYSAGSFFNFYRQFVSDMEFQTQHIAQPLKVSIPDEEDGETVEGTIDADQFAVFSPEMPEGRIIMLDYGIMKPNAERVVFVKCGMSNGLMDILTFEQEGGSWKLVEMEE